MSLFACASAFHIFMVGFPKKGERVLGYLGRRTMPIYILHIIFILQIEHVGQLILNTNPVTSLVLQITYSFTVSFVAIVLSLCTYRIIKYSPHLSNILFGE